MTFPGRSDSYYFLSGASYPSVTSTPIAAVLGVDSDQNFTYSTTGAAAMFFRVEQIPLTSGANYLADGIPDGWKLQHGVDPLDPNAVHGIPLGDIRTWLQIYQAEYTNSLLPMAYFPTASTTVIFGASNVSVPILFSKPYTGPLTYVLSGTAIPSAPGVTGDYVTPPGQIFINNATSANITINLVQQPDIEINRSIIVGISAPPAANQTYIITANSSVTTVHLVQSQLGVFLGTLTITNGLFTGAQSVKMALRPGGGGGTLAVFDVTGNALLGNMFAVSTQADKNAFQLSGSVFSNVLTNTPWGRSLNVSLSFGTTQTNGTTFITPLSLSLAGLTASGTPYTGSGILSLTRSQ